MYRTLVRAEDLHPEQRLLLRYDVNRAMRYYQRLARRMEHLNFAASDPLLFYCTRVIHSLKLLLDAIDASDGSPASGRQESGSIDR